MSIQVLDLGLIDYNDALSVQLKYVNEVQKDPQKKFLILCSHPPVVTLGRASTPEDLQGWSGETIEVSRGGKATYHGPSQLVIYPLLSLEHPHAEYPELAVRDLHSYLQFLENRVVQFLKLYDVKSQGGFSLSKKGDTDDKNEIRTGVWIGEKKIASIGIAVKRWVSYHGIAINILSDPAAFGGISPCGFTANTMTTLEAHTERFLNDFILPESLVKRNIIKVFSTSIE